MRPVERTAEQNVSDELDFIIDGLDEDVPYAKRILHTRPANWEIIAEEAKIYGNYSTLTMYASVFANATSIPATRRLNRWKCDLKNGKVSKTRKAILAYSREIDVELFDLVTIRRSAGLSIDKYSFSRLRYLPIF